MDGGSGEDTYYYYGDIERANDSDVIDGEVLDSLGTTNFNVIGFEIIDMSATDATRCSYDPERSWNNTDPLTLNLSEAQILAFASGNDLGSDTLYIKGEDDGTDRVDLSAFTDDDAGDIVGYRSYKLGAAYLKVEIGLEVTTDGTNYFTLN